MRRIGFARSILPYVLSALLPTATAADDFFKGRTINIIVGYGAGGGFDLAARLISVHYGRHIPGNPSVVVQNMPGASSVVAANYVFNVAPKDGTVLGALGSTIVLSKLLGQPSKYEPEKFNWIGRLDSSDNVAVTWHSTGVRTIADAKTKSIAMAAGASMGPAVMVPQAYNKLLGTKFKIVGGYEGSNAMVTAMERGEAGGTASFGLTVLLTSKKSWLENKLVNVLFISALERSAAVPSVPTMIDLAENDEQRAIFGLLTSESAIGRNLTAPPGVPKERAEILRRAFDKLIADPEFSDGLKAKGIELNPWPGEKLETYVNSIMSIDRKTIERAIWATSSN